MPIPYKKVRYASGAPGLLLLAGVGLYLAACDVGRPDKKPAAEVVLSDDALPPTQPDQGADTAETPGFDSVADAPLPPPTVAPTGEQAVSGTIVDFLCNHDTKASGENGTAPAACDLIIRTQTRGDRRMVCDVAPCDAWAARGSLPQGIRGLQAEAWITLTDTYDSSGNPAGRVARVTRLNVSYTAKP